MPALTMLRFLRVFRVPVGHAPLLPFLAAAALLSAAPSAHAEEWTKTFDLTGRPSVRIETDDGAVRVLTSGDSKQVVVRVEHHGYKPDRDFTVKTRQDGNRIEVSTRVYDRWYVFSAGDRSFKIEVRMPADADMQVETGDGSVSVGPVNGNVEINSGDGHIKLEGARGNIRVRTADGHIEALGLDGQLEAATGDGNIRVEGRLDRLNIRTGDGGIQVRALPGSKMGSSWSIRTGDGSVDLSLPENFQASIDAHTSDGHISLGLPLQVEGNLNRSAIRGKLNGGGESLSISTGDGSIRLSRS